MVEYSDDETEIMHAVSNYDFVDQLKYSISFSELPVRWNDMERLDGQRKLIFLHGSGDDGLQTIYKQVLEWKFNISDGIPEISVLSKGNRWILLQKPRKSYERIIRTILITVHCLCLMKNDPELSRKALWGQLSRVFSSYDPRPSENDLVDHIALIGEAVRRDKTLSKSAFLIKFLEEKPLKKKLDLVDQDFRTMARPEFIVDDHIEENDEEEGSDDDDALFDTVCSICDNGGELLCCDGRCLRSFHATENDGSESACVTLGYSTDRIKAMPIFLCGNCQHKQHQCFVCGKLGSSAKSAGAEVFPCISATCGYFYHPRCVAQLLHHFNADEAEKLEKKIASGKSFTCPIHKCHICKQGEDKNDFDLQFAVCRRCPKSYHRTCMPREITFESQGGLMPRAWDNLIPKRILIYCLDHEIDEVLGTPMRNHLKIPGAWQNKKKYASEKLWRIDRIVSKDSTSSLAKVHKQTGRSLAISNGKKVVNSSKIPQKITTSPTVNIASRNGHGLSLGDQLHALYTKSYKGVRIGKEEMPDRKGKNTMSNELHTKVRSDDYELSLDADSQRRILDLVTEASSMITMKDIIENSKLPITHANSSKNYIDKYITLGKVEGSIEAIREALHKINGGWDVKDAKAVCEPQLLHQIEKWKTKLRVYLSPFLYGMRYTSYGRHFTKAEKLKEIVNIVHCYVQEGDMIVDFCCGANEFSCFMKSKMDETGKKCFYKNYDLIQAKNDFNFEKRDWMGVRPKELLEGSKLIMGLNPPFGVNAALANKFINKALEFRPKLLILIVPQETERLDRKCTPYDLVWEDVKFLAGKSFYLPGSMDVNDNQLEDWNHIPPPLYLWSRQDWTATHRKIAEQHGHVDQIQRKTNEGQCIGNSKKKKNMRYEGSVGVQPVNQLLGKRKRENQYVDPFSDEEMRHIREMIEGEIVESMDVDEMLKDDQNLHYSSKPLGVKKDSYKEESSCSLMDNLYGHMGEGSTLKMNSDKFLYVGQLNSSGGSSSSSYLAGTVPEFEPLPPPSPPFLPPPPPLPFPLPPPPPPPLPFPPSSSYLHDFNHLNSYDMMQQNANSRFEMIMRYSMPQFPPPHPSAFPTRPGQYHPFYHTSNSFTPTPPPPLPYEEILNSCNVSFDDPPPPGVSSGSNPYFNKYNTGGWRG
ncbi:protein ENHANCED DOWNY MILDEW 2-like [Impatiens glandulifera]|uniref:protein ENHANCED DOWNY MILDEW 2-like n=1 Tax=Impatiens glandulifera TaxID=253017 RepID=UPI001FB0EA7E|nr:protein ENHANCED DOWNY MILDEW 2-like [Impatiens glandulifera]